MGERLPSLVLTPTPVDAVMYAAAMWEFQRLHFDDEWARSREALPGSILQGPLLDNYLAAYLVWLWGTQAGIRALDWRHHAPVVIGRPVTCRGEVESVADEGVVTAVGVRMWIDSGGPRPAVTAVASLERRLSPAGGLRA